MKKYILLLLLATPLLATTPNVTSNISVLETSNEFLKIVVTNSPNEKGRFAIETTQGDPKNKHDDNQLLIYGKPQPWTSYTTLKVDNINYIFGGPSQKSAKRSGVKLNFGEVTFQEKSNHSIITEGYIGPIQVIQKLTLFRNPSTRVKDSVLIQYTLINQDKQPHNVGLRLMLDTKLGSNDGAPFRIGYESITSEIKFNKNDLQDFWQTFDSLSSPNVIAQGTLKNTEIGLTPPHELVLANWGTLVDSPWEFQYEKDRSFIRLGEPEKDTAMAMYWHPTTLQPQQSIQYKTLYGLGDVSLSPGELSLGITAPADRIIGSAEDILIVGYILNTGGYDSLNTSATFILPQGFEIISGKKTVTLKNLPSGDTQQIAIKVRIKKHAKKGLQTIQFKATSDTLNSNSIRRSITLIAPPNIHSDLFMPQQQQLNAINYIPIQLVIKNPTKYTLKYITSTLTLPNELSFPTFETPKKEFSTLHPFQQVTANWLVNIESPKENTLTVTSLVKSASTTPSQSKAVILLTTSKSLSFLHLSRPALTKNQHFFVTASLTRAKPFDDTDFTLSFDPNFLNFTRITKSQWLRDTYQDKQFSVQKKSITLVSLQNALEIPYLELASYHFKTKKSGSTSIKLLKNNQIITEIPVIISERNQK